MPCNCLQQLCRSIIEYLNIPCFIRIACTLLIQHLNHHIVCGLIQERDHDICPFTLKFPSASFSMAASETSHIKSQVNVSGSV